jgi:hypothetical protein
VLVPGLPALRSLLAGFLLAALCACHLGGSSAAPPPSFSLAVTPAALTIPAGGGGYLTVTVTRSGGFSEAVSLALEGAPAGVQGTGGIAAGAQTGQVALLTAATLTPQSLDALLVRGRAGALSQSATFKLVIAAPLAAGELSPDRVQAAGAVQRAGTTENASVAMEPTAAATSAGGNLQVQHGFRPTGSPQ